LLFDIELDFLSFLYGFFLAKTWNLWDYNMIFLLEFHVSAGQSKQGLIALHAQYDLVVKDNRNPGSCKQENMCMWLACLFVWSHL